MKKFLIILLLLPLSVISAAKTNCYSQVETMTNGYYSIGDGGGFYIRGVTTNYDPKAKGSLKIFLERGACVEKKTYGNYVVKIYQDAIIDGSFEIIKNGVRVYAAQGYQFQVGSIYEEYKTNSLITIGTDITGDGQPNLVVSEWTGGMHSDFIFNVFEIGPQFKFIQSINAGHADHSDFKNLDDSPDLEFPLLDFAFVYWRVCFAESPMPKIILKFNGEKYELAQKLMSRPKLNHEKLTKLADKIKASDFWNHIEGNHIINSDPTNDQPPVLLWKEMLNLIYTGNMDQAWELFNLSWPKKIKGKQPFLKDFKEQLRGSRYWKELQEMNAKK